MRAQPRMMSALFDEGHLLAAATEHQLGKMVTAAQPVAAASLSDCLPVNLKARREP